LRALAEAEHFRRDDPRTVKRAGETGDCSGNDKRVQLVSARVEAEKLRARIVFPDADQNAPPSAVQQHLQRHINEG
jgi:hypothetical protein